MLITSHCRLLSQTKLPQFQESAQVLFSVQFKRRWRLLEIFGNERFIRSSRTQNTLTSAFKELSIGTINDQVREILSQLYAFYVTPQRHLFYFLLNCGLALSLIEIDSKDER